MTPPSVVDRGAADGVLMRWAVGLKHGENAALSRDLHRVVTDVLGDDTAAQVGDRRMWRKVGLWLTTTT